MTGNFGSSPNRFLNPHMPRLNLSATPSFTRVCEIHISRWAFLFLLNEVRVHVKISENNNYLYYYQRTFGSNCLTHLPLNRP